MDKVYWTMKNGQHIDVDDMTESHLRNTLKMIIRKSNKRKQKTGIDLAFSEKEIEALYDSRYGHDDNYWK
jgi:hypothetical protein